MLSSILENKYSLFIVITGAAIYLTRGIFPHYPQAIWFPLALAVLAIILNFLRFRLLILVAILTTYFLTRYLMADNSLYPLTNIFLAPALGFTGALILRFKIKYLPAIIMTAIAIAGFHLAGYFGIILGIVALFSFPETGIIYTGSSILVSLVLLSKYLQQVGDRIASQTVTPISFSILDPFILIGLFAGAGLVYLLSKYKLSFFVYIIPIVVVLLCGFTLGPVALGGMLLGMIVSSLFTPDKTIGTVLQLSSITALLIVSLIA